MFIGSQLHANATTWDRIGDTVRAMDDGPWHSAWVPDHLVPRSPSTAGVAKPCPAHAHFDASSAAL